jgi:hypothetical protein
MEAKALKILLLFAGVGLGAAWDATFGPAMQAEDGGHHGIGQRLQGIYFPKTTADASPARAGMIDMGELSFDAKTDQLAAERHNARVLQFCNKVMPNDVCSVAAAKWLRPELIVSHPSDSGQQQRTLRSMSVNIRACSDVKRLLTWEDGSIMKNDTSHRIADLALLDLSSVFQSLQGWRK